MPIDPTEVFPGDVLNLNRKPVTVLAVNRFWNSAFELVRGWVILRGDAIAADPRDLHTFCEQAQEPKQ